MAYVFGPPCMPSIYWNLDSRRNFEFSGEITPKGAFHQRRSNLGSAEPGSTLIVDLNQVQVMIGCTKVKLGDLIDVGETHLKTRRRVSSSKVKVIGDKNVKIVFD